MGLNRICISHFPRTKEKKNRDYEKKLIDNWFLTDIFNRLKCSTFRPTISTEMSRFLLKFLKFRSKLIYFDQNLELFCQNLQDGGQNHEHFGQNNVSVKISSLSVKISKCWSKYLRSLSKSETIRFITLTCWSKSLSFLLKHPTARLKS